MNKFLLPLFLIISSIAFGQGNPYPNYQQFGSAATRTTMLGAVDGKKGVIIGRYADTLTANNNALGNYIKFYPGAFIVTDNPRDELYQRNYNATAWISRGSVDITTINFITDSSVAFCFGNGVCDTISMTNFSTVVNNIVQNFVDSSMFMLNDSTLIICNGAGSCDTINLGNSLTFNIFLDTTSNTFFLSTCDTVQTLCLGDSCYQQQTCDTIPLTVMPPITLYFNGVERLPNTNIVVFGQSNPAAYSNAQLFYDTYLKTTSYGLHITGGATHTPILDVEQNQWSQLNSSIFALRHNGAFQPTYNLLDENNPVRLYLNYTDPFTIPTQGALAGDTIGFLGNEYAYMIMTNSRGSQNHYEIDDNNAKQVGIALHTYGSSTSAITIFGNQTPSAYPFHNNPPTDTTLLDSRIAIFKTDKDIQFPGYPNTRNDGTAPMAFYPDAQGNVKVGPVSGGSSITIINDTTITICSFGDFLCDTFITVNVNPIQTVTILNDSTLIVCDSLGVCDTLIITTPTGFDRGFFDPNQIQTANTYHQMGLLNFSVGRNLITGGVLNFNFLNNNAVSGNENVVFGRNMVVAGNTNFVGATDGQVFNTANYSATFGDAPINRGIAALTAGFGNKNWAENGFTMGSNNVNGSLNPTVGTANLYSNSTVLGLQNFSLGSVNFVSGSSLTANSATGFITQFGKSYTVTTPNSFNVGYTTNAFEITANKVRINEARFQEFHGTTTAAANDLALPANGNLTTISGSTQITAIATANWQAGSTIGWIFTGAPLVKHNTAGGAGTATMLLAGSADFQAAAGDNIEFRYDGTNWHEIGRTLATSSGSVGAANNGVSLSGGTTVQLGQAVAAPGNPAILLNHREIPSANFTISFNADAAQTNNIIQTKNAAAAIHARVTSTAKFSNNAGFASSEQFGDGVSVTAVSSTVVGNSSSGTAVNSIAFGVAAASAGGIAIGNNISVPASAIGIGTTVSQPGSLSVGFGSNAGDNNTIIGNNQAASYGNGAAGVGYQLGDMGLNSIGIGNQATPQHEHTIVLGAGTATTANGQFLVGANQVAVTGVTEFYMGNGVTHATTANRLWTITGQTGTDIAANSLTIAGSKGTGSGASAPIIFQTSVVGTTGATLQSLASRFTIGGDGSLRIHPITATAASAITPLEGHLVFVSTTDATFLTVGIWCYQNGAWKAL